MNIEQARFNMIEQQIRPWDVLDLDVLALLGEIRREEFVPAAWRSLAFADMEIPLGHGESMMAPKMEARIMQEMAIRPDDTVLEIGTGSGYLTALLAARAKLVHSIDIVGEFSAQAHARLIAHRLDNVKLVTADASRGWSQAAPYSAIILTGSTPVLPDAFKRDLTIGGRLFAILGDSPAMTAVRITRVSESAWTTDHLFETDIKPLVNALQPERFVF